MVKMFHVTELPETLRPHFTDWCNNSKGHIVDCLFMDEVNNSRHEKLH